MERVAQQLSVIRMRLGFGKPPTRRACLGMKPRVTQPRQVAQVVSVDLHRPQSENHLNPYDVGIALSWCTASAAHLQYVYPQNTAVCGGAVPSVGTNRLGSMPDPPAHPDFPRLPCQKVMSHYLHPLSIPSRNDSMSDESPYSLSSPTPTATWSTTTPSRSNSGGPHFLNIPGLSTQHIKYADSVDKLANTAAAAAAATPATSSTLSSSSSQGTTTH
ncbi:hypothetical protein BJV74DRAFT_158173 [Russula compacta]|nr:hypothetical protein BJV74DRAFT_158173 [Russula compacta]